MYRHPNRRRRRSGGLIWGVCTPENRRKMHTSSLRERQDVDPPQSLPSVASKTKSRGSEGSVRTAAFVRREGRRRRQLPLGWLFSVWLLSFTGIFRTDTRSLHGWLPPTWPLTTSETGNEKERETSKEDLALSH
ncbi:putative transmembrane protein [Toxoplasma gondii TgCatPRC2]|uniref:Transmembrane protein n=4 Tax=Toxoplasma gondii TaxID=5811 RepID=S8GJN7_TOXGM|nr:hypothetical protein TGME49_222305 [Toxoplasma gondii ME49]EPT32070.1 hypothetical protein TGME49_222305 [Toxoplasma gondii ME49]KYF42578.1 hypothetical protein TGARI_222305 [Toxoplasma gondii ARI]KYK69172.1 putative transmembrane protein [Toxoplasma gondii TgCatPRC2]|eukprot:XP_018638312.1 hypothetical protein TGME49_222305 [Toxoplasma gondii ME49]